MKFKTRLPKIIFMPFKRITSKRSRKGAGSPQRGFYGEMFEASYRKYYQRRDKPLERILKKLNKDGQVISERPPERILKDFY